ncbi:MAG: HAD-IC family P-type ATPase [Patescibacteria group bacterium]|jgi:Ca2+-transporting ATPase
MVKIKWYAISTADALGRLESSPEGLTTDVIAERRKRYGENRLPDAKALSPVVVFLRQFKSPLIAILIIAAGLSLFLREFIDAVIIIAILFFNAIIGFIQERRADSALKALQQMAQSSVVVVRDGTVQTIEQIELVPGDILVVETGDILAADARILEYTNLKVNESILTGEAVPVHKSNKKLAEKTAIPDRANMLFRGTTVVYGRARALVTATALETQYGSIVAEVQKSENTSTPIQQRFSTLSRSIGVAVIGVALLVVALGIARDIPIVEMILVGLSLAVSAIPEGLPIVVTITLAIGMWRMAKRKAIVRKLPAVETLGSVNLIASDKTGTLTFGEMMVQRAFVDEKEFTASGKGYQRDGLFLLHNHPVDHVKEKGLSRALLLGALCNNASLRYPEKNAENPHPETVGDPTEIALLVGAVKGGIEPNNLKERHSRIGEIPFDSDKKYMMTIHKDGKKELVAIKGAPEKILAMSSKIFVGGKVHKLTAALRDIIEREYAQMAHNSLRGIAVAELSSHNGMKDAARVSKEKNLTFVGLFGISDAIREEAATTISVAARAGIRTIMITGDHKDTAIAIAYELEILPKDGSKEDIDAAVIDGLTLDELSDDELLKRLPKLRVAARVSPEHKLRIVRLAKQQGNVVAVTGDGVNDAPALVEGDIGIAVDQQSTDAAKGASDILLTDGNFATIIGAVEEGRTIFANIRRVTLYLLSTNIVEALLILITLAFNFPLPLLPIQILWLNVVTDTFLDISIGTEPKHATVMEDGPNRREEHIINAHTLGRLLFLATIMLGIVFFVYRFTLANTLDLRYVYAMTLTALAVSQWFNSFNVRSGRESLFRVGLLRNKFHLGALGVVLSLQLIALYVPPVTKALHLVPLALRDWLFIIALGSLVFVAEEVRKFAFRHWRSAPRNVHGPAEPAENAR